MCPWTRDAPGSMGHEGAISESKRISPRQDTMPISTKSMGLPRPVVSESRTTKSPPERRERAQRTASFRLPIRAGDASSCVLLELPILSLSSHDAGATATPVSTPAGRSDEPILRTTLPLRPVHCPAIRNVVPWIAPPGKGRRRVQDAEHRHPRKVLAAIPGASGSEVPDARRSGPEKDSARARGQWGCSLTLRPRPEGPHHLSLDPVAHDGGGDAFRGAYRPARSQMSGPVSVCGS